jgi:hypothetical protein
LWHVGDPQMVPVPSSRVACVVITPPALFPIIIEKRRFRRSGERKAECAGQGTSPETTLD